MKTIIGIEKFWTLFIGIILMLWIALEWWIWGFNAICIAYFAFGLIEALLAIIGLKKR